MISNRIKRALISVSDKTNIQGFAEYLQGIGCEIISTGGTRKVLEDSGIKTIEISEVTGNPEAFGGRMKTISFNIESALLFDRERDSEEAKKLNIVPIDLVVCNLYPFGEVLKKGADFHTLIENIDIGGPTMLRAAAKNFKYVTVVTDPSDYNSVIENMKENDNSTTLEFRKELMRKVFNHTADYDSLIAQTMDEQCNIISKRMYFSEGKQLRYGENSHQKGYLLKNMQEEDSLMNMEILHGKEISFNNMVDIQGAIDAVKDLEQQGCAVVKHTNACGLAQSEDQRRALKLAWDGDPISAFGSIIAFNNKVELATVEFFRLNDENKRNRKFFEVIIAPDYSDEALDYLKFHKNIRIIRFDPSRALKINDYKVLFGSLLIQDNDQELLSKMDVVTSATFAVDTAKELVLFGIKSMKQIKSNSIVIVRKNGKDYQILGMGAGQPNRVISTKLAIDKCRENLKREYNGDNFEAYFKRIMGESVLVSDAFFPFADNVELAAEHGIKLIIQPGGSMRDKCVIKKADELGLNMIFTGLRHFKH